MSKDAEVKKRNFGVSFLIAGVATSGACIGSNPMEVVKTRMQLQGELAAKAQTSRLYRNSFHAFYQICATEGLRGIQRGLGPGMIYQTFMNGTRLGLFEPLQRLYGATDPTGSTFLIRNIAAGGTSGAIGAVVGSPFFLVKARIQAANGKLGQYQYKGMLDGFRSVVSSEGVVGLFRGVNGAIPRVTVGSAAQLSSYASSKQLILSTGLVGDTIFAHICASFICGLVVTTAMNPFDVVSTRLYSQNVVNGKGALYSGVGDCFAKILRKEGLQGFYKGWTAHYFRLGPHSILTFVFWEQLKKLATKYGY